MSTSAAPCLYRDENNIQCYKDVAGKGYCREHHKKGWSNSFREKRSEKYNRNRRTILNKFKGECQGFKDKKGKCFKAANEVDHITPKFEGGSDDLFNLTLLCKDCHTRKTQEEANRELKNKTKARPRNHQGPIQWKD